MLKKYAQGDADKYDNMRNNSEKREEMLKSFFVQFYTKPSIRKEYSVKLKPCPKAFKRRIFSIPMSMDSNIDASTTPSGMYSQQVKINIGIGRYLNILLIVV